jgi:hexosaminidase
MTQKHVTTTLLIVLFLFCAKTNAQVSIIPKPNDIKYNAGIFSYAKGFDIKIIRGDDATKLIQKQLTDFIKEKNIPLVAFATTAVTLNLLQPKATDIPSDGYTLTVSPTTIAVTSSGNAGLFYGVQSLMQLLKKDSVKTLPCLEIKDNPAFVYRGLQLDVSRHFFGVEVIKQYLDVMAKLKLNQFHWHLTDDQGWRVEIKKHPNLTKIGGCRYLKDSTEYCGYYTQEEIKQIVQYAKERYINIIPEIDLPGHSSAIIAAYPQLSCYNQKISVPNTFGIKNDILCPSDSTFQFLKEVFDEICVLFPGKYIHIGGDEVPVKQWNQSETGKKFSSENNIPAKNIRSYFLMQIEQQLAAKGKKCIGWGEIMDDKISKEITVMSWRGISAGIKAAKQGNDAIMTPRQYCYFDYFQDWDEPKQGIYMTYLPLDKVYSFNPLSKIKDSITQQHILGGQACLWTEFIDNPQKLEQQTFPRITALAECLWTKSSNKKFTDFEKRLKAQKNYFFKEKEMPKIDMVRIKPKKEN